MAKGLYKMLLDCGRAGYLQSLFIADIDEVKAMINQDRYVYFGEVLGKHSEVCGTLDESDIQFITDDDSIIEMVEKYDLCVGYNPINYIQDDEDNEDDEEE